MSSQAFFWVNIGLGVILLCALLSARKKRFGFARTQSGIFVYNGHNFDAYEVLGISRNASAQDFQKLSQQIESSNASDRDFKIAALRAIAKNFIA